MRCVRPRLTESLKKVGLARSASSSEFRVGRRSPEAVGRCSAGSGEAKREEGHSLACLPSRAPPAPGGATCGSSKPAT